MVYFPVCKAQALFDFSVEVSFKILFSTIPRSLSWEMYFFLEALFLIFHLVFVILIMSSATSLQKAKPHDHYLLLKVLHNLRKKNASHLNYKYSSMRVAAVQHHGTIPVSQIFGPHHVSLDPLGAWHWCQRVSPCSQRAAQAVARVPEHHGVEGCSFQLPQLCHSLHKSLSNKYS